MKYSKDELPPPPPPVLSAAGAQLLPLYFKTCPDAAPDVLTSDKSPNALAPPPDWLVQLSTPLPSVLSTWSALPSSFGNVNT